jgi:hypothetical protein
VLKEQAGRRLVNAEDEQGDASDVCGQAGC